MALAGEDKGALSAAVAVGTAMASSRAPTRAIASLLMLDAFMTPSPEIGNAVSGVRTLRAMCCKLGDIGHAAQQRK
jgi:hypothetical protein